MLPKKLQYKLNKRLQDKALRRLSESNTLVDFSSNDYLGFSRSQTIFDQAHILLKHEDMMQNGATGSRLLSGNHKLYTSTEQQISTFHHSETALIFNSGYAANLGLFSAILQRNDIILYDEYCHASIRDGISMSHAKAYKFEHNNLDVLEQLIERHTETDSASQQEIYIVTESVFSMDGDSPDLKRLSKISQQYNANLIIDEAHALGVFGTKGEGLVNELHIEDSVFARVITFGKALGCHGAAILCSQELKDYLINFSKPFIYTTAFPPHSIATISVSYDVLDTESDVSAITILQHNIHFFKQELKRLNLQQLFIQNDSAIQCCMISGNETVKTIADMLHQHGFDVKAILAPTVPKGKERLRFCLHSYNSSEEITKVLELLATFV